MQLLNRVKERAFARFPDAEEYWQYFVQFVPYYAAAALSVGHFVYTELCWVPRMDKPFRLDNAAISKSYVESELVSGGTCILLTVLVPMSVALAHCLNRDTEWKRGGPARRFERTLRVSLAAHQFHCAVVMLWVSVGVTGMLTNVLKYKISNFRPDFIARCAPKTDPAGARDALLRVQDACTQPDVWLLIEGLKSTPSGHSSMITTGCFYAWQWVRDHVTEPQPATRRARALRLLATAWLPLLAAAVMASRRADHRHHWYDVLSGCALAVTCVAAARLILLKCGRVTATPLPM